MADHHKREKCYYCGEGGHCVHHCDKIPSVRLARTNVSTGLIYEMFDVCVDFMLIYKFFTDCHYNWGFITIALWLPWVAIVIADIFTEQFNAFLPLLQTAGLYEILKLISRLKHAESNHVSTLTDTKDNIQKLKRANQMFVKKYFFVTLLRRFPNALLRTYILLLNVNDTMGVFWKIYGAIHSVIGCSFSLEAKTAYCKVGDQFAQITWQFIVTSCRVLAMAIVILVYPKGYIFIFAAVYVILRFLYFAWTNKDKPGKHILVNDFLLALASLIALRPDITFIGPAIKYERSSQYSVYFSLMYIENILLICPWFMTKLSIHTLGGLPWQDYAIMGVIYTGLFFSLPFIVLHFKYANSKVSHITTSVNNKPEQKQEEHEAFLTCSSQVAHQVHPSSTVSTSLNVDAQTTDDNVSDEIRLMSDKISEKMQPVDEERPSFRHRGANIVGDVKGSNTAKTGAKSIADNTSEGGYCGSCVRHYKSVDVLASYTLLPMPCDGVVPTTVLRQWHQHRDATILQKQWYLPISYRDSDLKIAQTRWCDVCMQNGWQDCTQCNNTTTHCTHACDKNQQITNVDICGECKEKHHFVECLVCGQTDHCQHNCHNQYSYPKAWKFSLIAKMFLLLFSTSLYIFNVYCDIDLALYYLHNGNIMMFLMTLHLVWLSAIVMATYSFYKYITMVQKPVGDQKSSGSSLDIQESLDSQGSVHLAIDEKEVTGRQGSRPIMRGARCKSLASIDSNVSVEFEDCMESLERPNTNRHECTVEQESVQVHEPGVKSEPTFWPESIENPTIAEYEVESTNKQESIEKPESTNKQESIENPEANDKQESIEISESIHKQESFEQPESNDEQESIESSESTDKQESIEKPDSTDKHALQNSVEFTDNPESTENKIDFTEYSKSQIDANNSSMSSAIQAGSSDVNTNACSITQQGPISRQQSLDELESVELQVSTAKAVSTNQQESSSECAEVHELLDKESEDAGSLDSGYLSDRPNSKLQNMTTCQKVVFSFRLLLCLPFVSTIGWLIDTVVRMSFFLGNLKWKVDVDKVLNKFQSYFESSKSLSETQIIESFLQCAPQMTLHLTVVIQGLSDGVSIHWTQWRTVLVSWVCLSFSFVSFYNSQNPRRNVLAPFKPLMTLGHMLIVGPRILCLALIAAKSVWYIVPIAVLHMSIVFIYRLFLRKQCGDYTSSILYDLIVSLASVFLISPDMVITGLPKQSLDRKRWKTSFTILIVLYYVENLMLWLVSHATVCEFTGHSILHGSTTVWPASTTLTWSANSTILTNTTHIAPSLAVSSMTLASTTHATFVNGSMLLTNNTEIHTAPHFLLDRTISFVFVNGSVLIGVAILMACHVLFKQLTEGGAPGFLLGSLSTVRQRLEDEEKPRVNTIKMYYKLLNGQADITMETNKEPNV